ncbi:MAG: RnfABCDGE type electron transport complex subunit D [Thiohalomonadaceae bacterium]
MSDAKPVRFMSGGSAGGTSPALPSAPTVTRVMATVVLALVPGIGVYAWLFGWGVLVSLGITVAAAYAFEAAMLRIRGRPVWPFLKDLSVLVTALLLGLALPPLAPWWIPVLGAFFAVVVAKHLYGGLGQNSFNPAMAGYAVVLVSFPLHLSRWPAPVTLLDAPLGLLETLRLTFLGQLPGGMALDAITSATVLDRLRTEGLAGDAGAALSALPFLEAFAGHGVEWVNLAFLLGGLWLLYRRIISWHIPVALLGGLALMAGAFHLADTGQYAPPLTHLFGGAAILAAFFIATDPVTAAATPRGKLIYGAAIGALIYGIRVFGGYPDGVAFAVLLVGLTVPLLDQYTRPRTFGTGGRLR